jgi:hypothetical protein
MTTKIKQGTFICARCREEIQDEEMSLNEEDDFDMSLCKEGDL